MGVPEGLAHAPSRCIFSPLVWMISGASSRTTCSEPGQVTPCRPRGPSTACRKRQTRPTAFTGAPFAKPRQHRWERHDPHVDTGRPCTRHERAVGRGDQSEAPRRALLQQAGDDFEQRGFCAAHSASWVQEKNPHSQRCRTMIVSPGWTMSVSLASSSFWLRMIRSPRFEPRSVSPPASEIAWRTVRLGSKT